jgi:hypothetical protein
MPGRFGGFIGQKEIGQVDVVPVEAPGGEVFLEAAGSQRRGPGRRFDMD